MEKNQSSSYRQIFKGTSLFGGVQVITILISIVKSKFVAVLLGPSGMGIMGLLTSNLSLVGELTHFGLGTSSVKFISEADASGDSRRLSRVVKVLRRLVWITGLLGFVGVFFLSRELSVYTFGNDDYTTAFRWLAVTLFIDQLALGQKAVLQGTRKLRLLARANIIGSLLGLLVSVPLYYLYGERGIVPSLLFTSVSAMLIAWSLSRRVPLQQVEISREDIRSVGAEMLKLGFFLSLTSLIGAVVNYLIRTYISREGGVQDVGLYNAGFTIINSYVGIVFTAMATDYFPRLSGIARDNKESSSLITQQSEVALLILGPILFLFILMVGVVITLLYSAEFTSITDMVAWSALAMYFRAVSWPVAYIIMARGESKIYLLTETFGNLLMLVCNYLGYKYYGITGVGISFFIFYIIYTVVIFPFCSWKYNLNLRGDILKLLILELSTGLVAFALVKYAPPLLRYILGFLIFGGILYYSVRLLSRKMNVNILEKLKLRK